MLFSFHSDNRKKLAIFLQKLAIFNIYHVFASFVKLCGYRFLYFFSLCDVRNKAVFLTEVKSKPRKKSEILAFKPLLQ